MSACVRNASASRPHRVRVPALRRGNGRSVTSTVTARDNKGRSITPLRLRNVTGGRLGDGYPSAQPFPRERRTSAKRLRNGFGHSVTSRAGDRRAPRSSADKCPRAVTKRDAILYSVGANAEHGHRRTKEDKDRAITILLNDPEWFGWSNVDLARRCNVDEATIRRHKEKHTSAMPKSDERIFIHPRSGKPTTMRTENIGKRALASSSGHPCVIHEPCLHRASTGLAPCVQRPLNDRSNRHHRNLRWSAEGHRTSPKAGPVPVWVVPGQCLGCAGRGCLFAASGSFERQNSHAHGNIHRGVREFFDPPMLHHRSVRHCPRTGRPWLRLPSRRRMLTHAWPGVGSGGFGMRRQQGEGKKMTPRTYDRPRPLNGGHLCGGSIAAGFSQ